MNAQEGNGHGAPRYIAHTVHIQSKETYGSSETNKSRQNGAAEQVRECIGIRLRVKLWPFRVWLFSILIISVEILVFIILIIVSVLKKKRGS